MGRLMNILVILLLAVVALSSVAFIVMREPDRSVASLIERWAPEPSRFMTLQGMSVHYRDEGNPDDTVPILLIHGTSASLHTWEGWAAALKQERRVISVDIPGFGLTGPFPHGDYRVERYAEFVVALMDELQVERAVLAGNSLGGYIVWETALRSPARVAALVLVDAAGYPYTPESIPLGFRLAQVDWLQPLVRQVLPRSAIEASVRNVYGDPEQVTEALIDRYFELTLREGNRAALHARFAAGISADDASQRLAAITQPTLILWGDQDRLIPLVLSERFLHDIPGSERVVFQGLGHVPQEEDPVLTVQAVQDFLARHVPVDTTSEALSANPDERHLSQEVDSPQQPATGGQ